jgi:hypothetical protein
MIKGLSQDLSETLSLKVFQKQLVAAVIEMPTIGPEWNQHKSPRLQQIFSKERVLMSTLKISTSKKIPEMRSHTKKAMIIFRE